MVAVFAIPGRSAGPQTVAADSPRGEQNASGKRLARRRWRYDQVQVDRRRRSRPNSNNLTSHSAAEGRVVNDSHGHAAGRRSSTADSFGRSPHGARARGGWVAEEMISCVGK
jgi:hypothetical protein